MDEIEIEVFRADTRASRGISSSDLEGIASDYNGEANPVPLVIGHPKNDSPAEGIVSSFRAEGNRLFAKLKDVSTDLVEKIRKREIINRSMAFFSPDHEANPTPGKLAPRHLGFLGGAAPGIPGMEPLKSAFEFSADGDTFEAIGDPAEAIIFEAPATPVLAIPEERQGMDPEELKARELELEAQRTAIAEEQAQLQADRTAFAAEQDATRKSANKSRVDALVTAGKVLPANAADLEVVFNALGSDELEFSADDKGLAADKLASILAAGPAVVDVTGERRSPSKTTFSADSKPTHAEVTSAANALMKENPNLTFEAALAEVEKEL